MDKSEKPKSLRKKLWAGVKERAAWIVASYVSSLVISAIIPPLAPVLGPLCIAVAVVGPSNSWKGIKLASEKLFKPLMKGCVRVTKALINKVFFKNDKFSRAEDIPIIQKPLKEDNISISAKPHLSPTSTQHTFTQEEVAQAIKIAQSLTPEAVARTLENSLQTITPIQQSSKYKPNDTPGQKGHIKHNTSHSR